MQGLKLIKTEKNKKILEFSHSMMLNAYAPYSNFSVGAAILSEGNRLFGGCNVENAAYPEGTCAEAGAISAMIAGGCKTIKEIYEDSSKLEKLTKNLSQYSDIKVYENINQELEKIIDAKN